MNIGQLIYFVNVISCDFNISTAANKLHVSQSTISKSITSFEKDEGIALFIRNGRKLLGLTNTGHKFYQDAKRVIKDYKHMLQNIHFNNKITGKISIGVASAIFDVYFPKIILYLRTTFPSVKVNIKVLGGESLQDQLMLEKLDLIYAIAPVKYDDLHTEDLINSNAAIIFNPSIFSLPKEITLNQLINYDMVLLDKSFTLREQIDTLFSYIEKSPTILCSSKSETFLLNMCRYNKVITILPKSILQGYRLNNLSFIPFNQLNWKLQSVYNTSNSNPLVKPIQAKINQLIQKNESTKKEIN